MKRAGVFLLVALAAALPSGSARADDEAASTELFNAGRDLMKAGDYAAACPKLAESVRLKATVGALAKLAACEEHEKRMVSAYARWQQALNLARSEGDERTPDVERELARVDKLVPKLDVSAAGPLPEDAVIHVDDTTLGAASLGVPLAVEAGSHTIRATAANRKPWSTTVQTSPDGATTHVAIPPLEEAPAPMALPPPPAAPSAPPAAVLPSPPLSEPARSPWPVVGLLTAGAGVAVAATGGALGFVALGKRDAAHCPGNTCPDAAAAATLGDAKTAADWSTALLITGGALAAGGITLWVVSRHDGSPAARVGAALVPGGVLVAGAWR